MLKGTVLNFDKCNATNVKNACKFHFFPRCTDIKELLGFSEKNGSIFNAFSDIGALKLSKIECNSSMHFNF